MSSINYSEKIPNNVNLSDDRTLQRALQRAVVRQVDVVGDLVAVVDGAHGAHVCSCYFNVSAQTLFQSKAAFSPLP